MTETAWPVERTKVRFERTDGQYSPLAKLTREQAIWIVECESRGVSNEELAAMMGVSYDAIRRVCTGRAYREATIEARRSALKRRGTC